MDLKRQIKYADLMCKNNYIDLEFSKLYPFTTENISGYISKFNLNNKSLLTVGSSGDQIINAILFNCNDISIVDVCPFTKFYFNLKKAALITLSYEEFFKFFCYENFSLLGNNINTFNEKTFYGVLNTLKELDCGSYLFWEELINKHKLLKIRKNLFSRDEYSKYILKKINPDLNNNEMYKKTQSLIADANPNFIINDILNVNLEKKYDNIWLSNIGQYMPLDKLKQIVDKLDLNLNADGKLLLCYLYKFVKEMKYNKEWSEVYNLEKVNKLLKDYNLSIESFIGVSSWQEDSILLYKKR